MARASLNALQRLQQPQMIEEEDPQVEDPDAWFRGRASEINAPWNHRGLEVTNPIWAKWFDQIQAQHPGKQIRMGGQFGNDPYRPQPLKQKKAF